MGGVINHECIEDSFHYLADSVFFATQVGFFDAIEEGNQGVGVSFQAPLCVLVLLADGLNGLQCDHRVIQHQQVYVDKRAGLGWCVFGYLLLYPLEFGASAGDGLLEA